MLLGLAEFAFDHFTFVGASAALALLQAARRLLLRLAAILPRLSIKLLAQGMEGVLQGFRLALDIFYVLALNAPRAAR